MKHSRAPFYLKLAAVILFIAGTRDQAQQLPQGRATDFTSETYFDPPHETRLKMRLSGTSATPLPGGLLDVKNLKIETYSEEGRLEAVVQSPQCTYAPLDGVARSPGKLEMRTGDGRLHIEGEGFLWRQNEGTLTISNKVRTLVDMTAAKSLTPKVP